MRSTSSAISRRRKLDDLCDRNEEALRIAA
jgi:hypothetical protein